MISAFTVGVADFRGSWGWRSWIGGWLVRIIAQAVFFTLIGQMLHSSEHTRFLLVGNTVMVGCTASMLSLQATAWQRLDGTYPLLVIAPTSPLPAFVGRTSVWLLDGCASSVIAFYVVGALFGLPLSSARVYAVVPLLVLVNVSIYCLAIFLGALAARRPGLRNMIMFFGTLILMAVCGVNVPVSFWPAPIQLIANILPLTHGLAAIRLAIAGGPLDEVVGNTLREAAIGLAWLAAASLTFRVLVNGGRRDGSIELSE